MSTATTETMIKMVENIPDVFHDRVLEHMREYIDSLCEEVQWNDSFSNTQNKLIAAAKQARKEIAEGKSTPLNLEKL